MNTRRLTRRSVHESGHICLSHALGIPIRLAYLQQSQDGTVGNVVFDRGRSWGIEQELAALLGGFAAENLILGGSELDVEDQKRAQRLAKGLAGDNGDWRAIYAAAANGASKIIAQQREKVETLAATLEARHTLTGPQIAVLMAGRQLLPGCK